MNNLSALIGFYHPYFLTIRVPVTNLYLDDIWASGAAEQKNGQ